MATETDQVDTEPLPTDTAEEEAAPPSRRRFHMTGRRWLWLSVALALMLAAGFGSYLLFRPRAAGAAQGMSRTVEVTRGTQTLTVGLDGTLSPRKSSDVNFTVSGTITAVYVKAGDTVKKNQKLAQIDDGDLTNAVDVAEANLTTARTNYSEVVDNNDGSSAAIASVKAQVSSAKAALTSARQNLDDAVLRSPIAGTIASVSAEEGDTVSGSGSSSGSTSSGSGGGSNSGGSGGSGTSSSTSSTAQFSVISTSTWKVEGTVGSTDLSSIKAGQSVAVTPSGATESIKGTVASVGIVASSSSSDGTATFPVVINLSGTHSDLYSGTTASAVITTGTYDDVLSVATAAISTSDGKSVVTKVDGTSTSVVEVETGRVFGDSTEITSGLAEGDQVQITFTRPSGTSTTGSDQSQGGGFGGGGFGGGGFGGGGGGQPPGGGGNGNGGNGP
ncbi:efflux RND transporter periplasmic adaptor subunit [Micropruina sonneratiae]|uniref:efflux RND transporter periplasmic adaptor subunit n=1 Tax=Micropruina sonneratiae TaxID=2986940 RepID=UPI002227F4C3|nr:biotin/lipoyl-binding protein [Micropruina sp. KQZ13P-5]MCW3158072.1 biotin/lipoyl-binding protein [Micropruina sp. KQZ13P-5]